MSATPERGYGTDKWSDGETLAEAERLPDGTIRYTVVSLEDEPAVEARS